MTYRAPLDAMHFALKAVVKSEALFATGAVPDLTEDVITAVLAEAGKLAAEVWAPSNRPGDLEGCRLEDGQVFTPPSVKAAYQRFAEGGWAGLSAPVEFGGQGLPRLIEAAVQELWTGSNMALSLCPMLSRGAIAALTRHGTDEQKRLFLPKLVSGLWTGTMNLTEPQAGSDVGALRTKAEPRGDGTYRITGTKIFITWGEHDAAENIVHLVLARLPGAPAGTRGISLFLVPKFLVNADGSLGARNDVHCLGLEKKLGIHASPTCVMGYGEHGGAVGTLVGEENRGMACMFTMMNDARLSVGIEGLGLAEAAYQKALAYARDRRQGRVAGEALDPVPILAHPDVRRMLATMKAQIEVARALCYATALALDLAEISPDKAARQAHQSRAELLTPLAKAWSTEIGVQVASLGVQVHGGAGFIEQTGAAQFLRDARIAPIYEGTNGIQAIDLITRKLPLEGGQAVYRFISEMKGTARALVDVLALSSVGEALADAITDLARATDWLQMRLRTEPQAALAGAMPYLALFGTVAGGHYLGRGALAAARAQKGGRVALARFYAENKLKTCGGLAAAAMAGAHDLAALGSAGFEM